jgi:hypothetical protein
MPGGSGGTRTYAMVNYYYIRPCSDGLSMMADRSVIRRNFHLSQRLLADLGDFGGYRPVCQELTTHPNRAL